MAYGLKYLCTFDSLKSGLSYRVELQFKDYSGVVYPLTGASNPIIIDYPDDNPMPAIKGCGCKFTVLNRGSNPISTFYSTDDDTIRILVYWGAQLIFSGFTVQDDFSEILTDATHEITLSATDNLGLLKDVPFNEAATAVSVSLESKLPLLSFLSIALQKTNLQLQTNIYANVYTYPVEVTFIEGFTAVAAQNLFVYLSRSTNFYVGQVIVVSGSLHNNGTYTITAIGNNYYAYLTVTGTVIDETNTLNVHITTQVHTWWAETLIDPGTFITSESSFESTYTVIEKILDRFKCTLFQADGVWNIIRNVELRQYSGAIPYRAFDYQFSPLGSGVKNPGITTGFGQTTFPEYGIMSKPLRPYKYTKETFMYKQPARILKNSNLQSLGALIRQYTSGAYTYKEYEFLYWLGGWGTNISVRFIRVVYDSFGNEVDRYAVVKGATFDSARSVASDPIEVNAGDRIKFSFSTKTLQSMPGSTTAIFAVRLINSTLTRYIDELPDGAGAWITGLGFNYTVNSGDNFNEWHSVEIASSAVPFDGLLYCYLRQQCTDGNETQYKDIAFEYTPYINGSAKIIGHTHTNTQNTNTKNRNEKDIYIDTSPSNSIAGTIFLPFMDGLLQKRTLNWHNNLIMTRVQTLGDLTTFDELFWRRITRLILEGNFVNLLQNGVHLSLLDLVFYNQFPGKYFVWGRLSMDLKNSYASGTLWEVANDTESDGDLSASYEFKYLYDTK
jgi:hypothetical protein